MSSSQAQSYETLYSAGLYLAATTFVSGISWGIMTCLYSLCMYNLVCNPRSTRPRKKTSLLAAWTTILWMLSSISTIANAYCSIYAYSWELNYPGGPETYLEDVWNKPIPILAYCAYIVTMWSADVLMLWRLFVFYHGVNPLIRGFIFCFAFLIYVGAVGAGCFTIVILGINQTMDSKHAVEAVVSLFTLSVVLNVFVTSAIAARLLYFRRFLKRVLGTESPHASLYTSITAMLMESSALYAVWSLVFIILYALNNPVQNIMLATLCNVQVIAPMLIVFRISRGINWERTTSAKLASKQLCPALGTASMVSTPEGGLTPQTVL